MAYKLVPKGRTSNPSVGRHASGSPVGKFTPNKASQGASGNYGVGTGRNQKTAARKEMSPRRTQSGANFNQADSLIRQGPEPFRTQNSPAMIPARRELAQQWGQPYEQTSQPGSHPNRAPGVNVPSQSAINTATGNPDRPYKGLNPINSGKVTSQAPKKNTDNGAQAQARFDRDFMQAYKDLKHTGGLS